MATSGDAEWFEYSKAANPVRPGLSPQVPFHAFPAELYASGLSRVIPLDLSGELGVQGPATSPALCANFVRILAGDTVALDIATGAATSQVAYVIRGSGRTQVQFARGASEISWKQGDILALPGGAAYTYEAGPDGAALYLVHDAPLLRHLGVTVSTPRFEPTVYPAEVTRAVLADIAESPGANIRNRISVLLGTGRFPQLRTITHVIWAMYGIVQPRSTQKPHRHQSVALDFVVSAEPGAVYTLLGRELDTNGKIKNPVRQDWTTGMAFTTPPGYWHAHFNEGDKEALILPLQDAGLQTYLRALDIRFG
jgi:gentisate 1,2-dioxygenase